MRAPVTGGSTPPSRRPVRSANEIDVHVGLRVRQRRREIGMSQDQLARLLGVAAQQVQKYERGANRISASRLFEIASALGTPVGYFFQGLDGPDPQDEAECGE